MKHLLILFLALLTFPLYAQVSSDHPINEVMDKYDIKATTISFHPNGACLISTFQHGKIDKSTNGAYYLRKEDDTWGTDPVRIEELPYAACFTFVDEETIGFLKGGRLRTVDKKQLIAWID